MLARIGTSALIVVLAAGCKFGAGAETGEEEFKAVLPAEGSLQVAVPEAAGGNSTLTVGQLAPFYVVTRVTSTVINAHVGAVLGLLWVIVHHPATTVSAGSATWGPFTPSLSPVTYRLVVTRVAPGDFDYHLDGRPKSSSSEGDFQTILAGNALPSHPIGRGSGDFTLHLDVAHALDPIGTPGSGLIEVAYNLGASPRSLSVHFEQVGGDNSGMDSTNPVTADYEFRHADDNSGDFQFSVHGNILDTSATLEDGQIRSRWLATGAGRSDARIENGDAGAGVTASECWDSNFRRVYFTMAPAFLATEGNASACVYDSALFAGN